MNTRSEAEAAFLRRIAQERDSCRRRADHTRGRWLTSLLVQLLREEADRLERESAAVTGWNYFKENDHHESRLATLAEAYEWLLPDWARTEVPRLDQPVDTDSKYRGGQLAFKLQWDRDGEVPDEFRFRDCVGSPVRVNRHGCLVDENRHPVRLRWRRGDDLLPLDWIPSDSGLGFQLLEGLSAELTTTAIVDESCKTEQPELIAIAIMQDEWASWFETFGTIVGPVPVEVQDEQVVPEQLTETEERAYESLRVVRHNRDGSHIADSGGGTSDEWEWLKENGCPQYRDRNERDDPRPTLPKKLTWQKYTRAAMLKVRGPVNSPRAGRDGGSIVREDQV